jgi:hypothetical protein
VNHLARFEAACARIVEGTFARIFPSALEPAQVGRKLLASQALTPTDTFLVRVHPVDYARFAEDRTFLEARWSAMLHEAQPQLPAPRAILHEDPTVIAGSVEIEAVVDEPGHAAMLVTPDGKAHELRDGMRIGRDPSNDLVVHDGRVSRSHARIVLEGKSFAIEDVGSTNGTFVDGVAVKRANLAAGMRLIFGETVIDVR